MESQDSGRLRALHANTNALGAPGGQGDVTSYGVAHGHGRLCPKGTGVELGLLCARVARSFQRAISGRGCTGHCRRVAHSKVAP